MHTKWDPPSYSVARLSRWLSNASIVRHSDIGIKDPSSAIHRRRTPDDLHNFPTLWLHTYIRTMHTTTLASRTLVELLASSYELVVCILRARILL